MTRDEVLQLHRKTLELYGGMPGLREPGALDSSIAQPQTCVFGHERFPTLIDKAGAYCFFIVRNHPFCDGNKRAGFLAAIHFMLRNGCILDLDSDRMNEAIQAAACGVLDVDEFLAAFRDAVRPP